MALKSPRQGEALAELDVEIDNARAAWDWAMERGHVARLDEALEGLCRFYEMRLRREEGEAACRAASSLLSTITGGDGCAPDEAIASAAQTLRVLAKVLAWQACFTFGLGRGDEAAGMLEHALALLARPELTDRNVRVERALVLLHKGHIEENRVVSEARESLEEALAICRELGDRWGMAAALVDLGWVYLEQTGIVEGRGAFEESLALFRALGDWRGAVDSLYGLSAASWAAFELDESERLAREALDLSQQTGDAHARAYAWHSLGIISWARGEWDESQSFFETCLAVSTDAGDAYTAELARWFLCAAKVDMGEYEQARVLGEVGVRRAREIGLHQQVAALYCLLGRETLARHRYQRAEALFEEGYDAMKVRSV